MSEDTSKKLGELLLDFDYITEKQFEEALEQQKESEEKLGRILLDLNYIEEKDLVEALEIQLGIPRVDFSSYILNTGLAQYLPEQLARRYEAVPLEKDGNILKVAMTDPSNIVAIDDIENNSGLEVKAYLAAKSDIENAVNQIYAENDSDTTEIINDLNNYEDEEPEIDELREMVEEAPIVRLANYIINNAFQLRASDIHIEPEEDEIRVRYRIDGVLSQHLTVPKHSQAALISRLKIMADLDITERRIPQDGRVKVTIDQEKVDMRVSTLPTIFGEKVVIRLLKKNEKLLNLDRLGFNKDNLKKFKKLINKPHGIILVTGPTGSGKSTTLFAALNKLNTVDKNIVTIEDPVEYQFRGINQVHARPKINLTFARTLRSLLRQDPDIIMVGEIRDEETAEIAVRAALTGHLVFSTVHTNDAVSTISRLVDMGIPPYLVSSSLIGVLSQRLVRKICDNCKEKYKPDNELIELLQVDGLEYAYRGKGCNKCNNTGYQDRLAVQELLLIDNKIKQMISEEKDEDEIKDYAINNGMITLKSDGISKLKEGLTTINEIRKIII